MLTQEQVKERVSQRFKCKTKKGEGPAPHKLPDSYGQHASYVEDGYRIWGFVSEKARDKFLKEYKSEAV